MRPPSCGGAQCWQCMVQCRSTCTLLLCGLPSSNPQTSCLPCLPSGAHVLALPKFLDPVLNWLPQPPDPTEECIGYQKCLMCWW